MDRKYIAILYLKIKCRSLSIKPHSPVVAIIGTVMFQYFSKTTLSIGIMFKI